VKQETQISRRYETNNPLGCVGIYCHAYVCFFLHVTLTMMQICRAGYGTKILSEMMRKQMQMAEKHAMHQWRSDKGNIELQRDVITVIRSSKNTDKEETRLLVIKLHHPIKAIMIYKFMFTAAKLIDIFFDIFWRIKNPFKNPSCFQKILTLFK